MENQVQKNMDNDIEAVLHSMRVSSICVQVNPS